MGHFDVVDKISTLPLLSYKGVEDLVDKMSFIATCIFLIACSLIVTLREYVMDPITCYMSNNPGGENLLAYVERYCWVQGTMAYSDRNIPTNDKDWREFEKSRIVYYQWVPFMLLFQAALFHVPKIIWTLFCFNMTGIDLKNIMESADKYEPDDLAKVLEDLLVQHREYRKGYFHRLKSRIYRVIQCLVISKRFGTWLSCGYVLMKILYLVNSVGQIYLMQVFLHLNSHEEYSSSFGLEVTRNIIKGHNWESTLIFPRVAYCAARLKHMAAVNIVTAQCVLTANLFIEKIYIFLWFWIMMVALFTSYSLLAWVFRLFLPSRHFSEINKHLRLHGHEVKTSSSIEPFCRNFLRPDGMFLLHMIKINAGDLVAGHLVSDLYSIYLAKYKDQDFLEDSHFSYHKTNANCNLLPKKSDSSTLNS